MANRWATFNRPAWSSNLSRLNGVVPYNIQQRAAVAGGDMASARRLGSITGNMPGVGTAAASTQVSQGGQPDSVADALRQANAANEQRYQQALGIYDTMHGNASGFGATEMNDLNRNMQQRRTGTNQSLISRGLGNTTIVDSVQSGINREGDEAKAKIQDLVARQKNDILAGKAGVIERRNDLGPDMALAAALQRASSGALLGGIGGSSGGRLSADPRAGFGASINRPGSASRTPSIYDLLFSQQQQSSTPTAHMSQYLLSQAISGRGASGSGGGSYSYGDQYMSAPLDDYNYNNDSKSYLLYEDDLQNRNATDDFWSQYESGSGDTNKTQYSQNQQYQPEFRERMPGESEYAHYKRLLQVYDPNTAAEIAYGTSQ